MTLTQPASIEFRRAGWFTLVLLVVNGVFDGFSGRPSPLLHQLLLLPLTAIFLFGVFELLSSNPPSTLVHWTPYRVSLIALSFQLLFAPLYLVEVRQFHELGYSVHPVLAVAILLPSTAFLALAIFRRLQPATLFIASLLAYIGDTALSIVSFPINYLRSDILPVILWADQNVLRHVDPYTTMYVGGRVYDFPYLPGMIVVYLPFVAAHIDMRIGSMLYTVGVAVLFFWASRRDRRIATASLIALFLLGPFLLYRHELYIQPHWFALALAFVLMQRRHYAWAALVFGFGMAIYQFSWIMFPFVLLNALRRRGWFEVLKLAALGAAGAFAIVGPFLASASRRIANNTVGQWGLAPHANADPVNLSYWVTYFVRPDKLLRLQAALMVAIFLYCLIRNRCRDLTDTLRWMVVAVTVFVLLNVLVDGYFFLMLLVLMLAYTCVANGWWSEPAQAA